MSRRRLGFLRIPLMLLIGLVAAEGMLKLASLWFTPDSRSGGTRTVGEGGLTVWCIGDSNTFGYGVEGKDSYPAALERILDERVRGAPHRVVNFGIPGLNSRQVLDLLGRELEAETFESQTPDVVLVQVGANNFWSWIPDTEVRFETPPWYERLRIARLLRLVWFQIKGSNQASPVDPEAPFLVGDFEEQSAADGPGKVNTGFDRQGRTVVFDTSARDKILDNETFKTTLSADLAEMERIAREANVPLFRLTYGSDEASYRQVNTVQRELDECTPGNLIDLAPHLTELAIRAGKAQVFFPDRHPREIGYRAIARTVYNALTQAGIARGEPFEDVLEGLSAVPRPPPPIELLGSLDGAAGTAEALRLAIRDEEPGREFRFLISGTEGAPAQLDGMPLPLVQDTIFDKTLTSDLYSGVIDENGGGVVSLAPLIPKESREPLRGLKIRVLYLLLTDSEQRYLRRISDPVEFELR